MSGKESVVRLNAEVLAGFAMLEGVGLTARKDLLDASEVRQIDAGEVIIRQGEPNATMYMLVEGELAVHLDDTDNDPLALIASGELVGELSLLDGSVASAYVTTHSPCTVLVVGEDAFWTLTKDSHAFALSLLVKLAERLRANNNAVSMSVKKRRMFERAAMFDALTGIHNRRWLDETLHRLVLRHLRDKSEISVSLIDIDHFKKFNDTYGHDAGDHVLTVVAERLASNLRPTDLVARFGGEEFVVIFPDASLNVAKEVAERLRKAIESEVLQMEDGTKLPGVTISMGVAQLESDQSVPSLLKVADSAMYRAKDAGRNRVFTGTSADTETA